MSKNDIDNMSDKEIMQLPSRSYAKRNHKCIGSTEGGVYGRDPDSCSGYKGVNWYDVFVDEKGNKYIVYRTDNADGGKGAYDPEEDRMNGPEIVKNSVNVFGTFADLFKK